MRVRHLPAAPVRALAAPVGLLFALLLPCPAAWAQAGAGCVPGGTLRNHDSYGHKLDAMDERTRNILCDPQTSGGLLVAVGQETEAEFLAIAEQAGLALFPIGRLQPLDGARFIEVIQ